MTKDRLLEIIKGILETDVDLHFLLHLNESELEKLTACIRERVEQARQ